MLSSSTYIFSSSILLPLTSSLSSLSHINAFFFHLHLFKFHSSSTYIFFIFFISHQCFLLPLTSFQVPFFFHSSFQVHHSCKCQESCHTSLLGPSIDLGLDLRLSASLYISFLRISATCCVSWTNRLFEKASPMNGFDVSLPVTI